MNMTERQKCLVLLSKNVFTAAGQAPFDGFVAVEGNKIAAWAATLQTAAPTMNRTC